MDLMYPSAIFSLRLGVWHNFDFACICTYEQRWYTSGHVDFSFDVTVSVDVASSVTAKPINARSCNCNF